MTYIPEDCIVFWTVLTLLAFSPKVALVIMCGGLTYNLIVSILNRPKKGNP